MSEDEVRYGADSAFKAQVGGDHYRGMAIQPAEFCHRNALGSLESMAIGYLCRWRQKGGLEDLRKAKHTIELLIEMESELLHAQAATVCTWEIHHDDGNVYDGSCGVHWDFERGGPENYSITFCPQCGGRLKMGKRKTETKNGL